MTRHKKCCTILSLESDCIVIEGVSSGIYRYVWWKYTMASSTGKNNHATYCFLQLSPHVVRTFDFSFAARRLPGYLF